jgi:hypothetical protein
MFNKQNKNKDSVSNTDEETDGNTPLVKQLARQQQQLQHSERTAQKPKSFTLNSKNKNKKESRRQELTQGTRNNRV